EHVELDTLLKTSDIVSVNVKAHKAEGLISAEKIGLMREGTYFINTSDGNAVDQEVLTQRMLEDSLHVALDVYQGLPTTKTLGLDDDHRGKVGSQLSKHVLWYRAGWKTQESIRVKTYKLLGHMMEALDG
ncbi:MAG: NAD(P)-dependent oxidoreductase, partial [Nanoarchaeota archaeon]